MEHIDYHHISKTFRHKAEWTDAEPLSFVNEGADLYNLSFTSAHAHHLLGYSHYRCEAHELDFEGEPVDGELGDGLIRENISFRYPLVRESLAGNTLGMTSSLTSVIPNKREETCLSLASKRVRSALNPERALSHRPSPWAGTPDVKTMPRLSLKRSSGSSNINNSIMMV